MVQKRWPGKGREQAQLSRPIWKIQLCTCGILHAAAEGGGDGSGWTVEVASRVSIKDDLTLSKGTESGQQSLSMRLLVG